MSFVDSLPLLNSLALLAIGAAVMLWRINRPAQAAGSTAAAVPASQQQSVVRKSKYASVSSADFSTPLNAAGAAGTSPATQSAQPAEPPLSPSESRAVRLESTRRYSTIKAFRLVAAARHRRKQQQQQQQQRQPPDARPASTSRLEGSELSRAGEDLASLYPPYDASDARLPSLRRFQHVAQHTHCIFAKKSKVWGSPPTATIHGGTAATAAAAASPAPAAAAAPPPSVEEQTLAAVPGLIDFTLRIKESYPQLRDDASISDLAAAAHAAAAPTSSSSSETAAQQLASVSGDTRSLLQWAEPASQWNLDAFVVEIAGARVGDTLSHFATTVRGVLAALSVADPVLPVSRHADLDSFGVDVAAAQCMQSLDTPRAEETFSSARWHFKFMGETFFVTCFAPCYPGQGNARYMFTREAEAIVAAATASQQADGAAPPPAEPHLLHDFSSRCFVLFQPELAFLRHNLSPDTPHTNWAAPRTERDRIRGAFRRAGREYVIPDTVAYPTAHYIVPPLLPFSQPIVKWWQTQPDDDDEGLSSSPAEAAVSSA